MGFFVNKRKVYRIEVKSAKDPETGERQVSWVDVRKMAEGDIQDRQDVATRIRTEQRKASPKLRGHLKKGAKKRRGQPEENAQMQYALGELRGFDLVRSIVDWGLEDDEGVRVPPTPENIRSLDPYTAQQIHDEIAQINPSIFPGGADEDDDDEDDEDDDLEREPGFGDSQGSYALERQSMSEDDEMYGVDEDAPSEVGGAAEDLDDDDEAVDPTRRTSVSRPSRG